MGVVDPSQTLEICMWSARPSYFIVGGKSLDICFNVAWVNVITGLDPKDG
jgi:hypothetical protein